MTVDKMGWFSVRIVLKQTVEDARAAPALFEELILLVQAATEDEAAQQAEQLARAKHESYSNEFGNLVIWEFREVLDVKRLLDDTVGAGSEVYYGFLTEAELNQVRSMLTKKLDI